MTDPKVNLNKQLFNELPENYYKKIDFLGNDKLLGIFDIVNTNGDKVIDKKEIKTFVESIFSYSKENIIDKKSLKLFLDNNTDKFKDKDIEENDIINFLKLLINKKSDTTSNVNDGGFLDQTTLETSEFNRQSNQASIISKELVIRDDNSNIIKKIDLEKLLAPFTEAEKKKIISVLRNLPTDVLLDMAAEVTFHGGEVENGTDGMYMPFFDVILLRGGSFSAETIVHEIGHAIDHRGKGECGYYQTDKNSNFSIIFNKEMTEYRLSGNKKSTRTKTDDGYQITGDNNYATTDKQEMFAECYTLITLGHCPSAGVISEYFKETCECVRKIVEKTRTLSARQRH